MNINDLAAIMGKTRQQVEEMLDGNDVIELNLKERKQKSISDNGMIEIIN